MRPDLATASAYYVQSVGTQTFLTMGSDGICTANTKDNANNAQKWYFDKRGGDVAIHSALNGYYLSFASLGDSQRIICTEQTEAPKIYQLQVAGEGDQYIFAVQGTPNIVLDVNGSNNKSGTNVILYTKHGKANQVWLVTPADM